MAVSPKPSQSMLYNVFLVLDMLFLDAALNPAPSRDVDDTEACCITGFTHISSGSCDILC